MVKLQTVRSINKLVASMAITGSMQKGKTKKDVTRPNYW